ncbi:MAG: Zn-ribbon domain-containing OB-fold protein [Chloroflexi bacterium]|nr:Zn-ribbon domain-containing OB-fold protein [Chloroflexota bacterium]
MVNSMRIARNWRTRQQRYSLVGEVCTECGHKIFPPRDVCPHCTEPAQLPYTLSGRGEVYSYATMYSAPQGFEEYLPYTVALVQLQEGPMLTSQLTDVDADEVRIGMPVEMVTRKLREDGEAGQILYGYKFRPLLAEQPAA